MNTELSLEEIINYVREHQNEIFDLNDPWY